MSELRQRIQDVIQNEPVAVFMKGTPQFVMCGNSDRALRALREAGAPVTGVGRRAHGLPAHARVAEADRADRARGDETGLEGFCGRALEPTVEVRTPLEVALVIAYVDLC